MGNAPPCCAGKSGDAQEVPKGLPNSPRGVKGCEEGCQLDHDNSDVCVICGSTFIMHDGHKCPKGGHGSFRSMSAALSSKKDSAVEFLTAPLVAVGEVLDASAEAGCEPGCEIAHSNSDVCTICGSTFIMHNGHICPKGGHGSFRTAGQAMIAKKNAVVEMVTGRKDEVGETEDAAEAEPAAEPSKDEEAPPQVAPVESPKEVGGTVEDTAPVREDEAEAGGVDTPAPAKEEPAAEPPKDEEAPPQVAPVEAPKEDAGPASLGSGRNTKKNGNKRK